MIKNRLVVILILLLGTVNLFSQGNSDFVAEEVFFSFYPADRYLNIIEYNILSLKDKNIPKQIQDLEQQIEEANYVKSKYNFESLLPVEETITNEGKYVKGDFHLVSNEVDEYKLLVDVFEKMLEREVEIVIKDNELKIMFDKTGLHIGSNNALNALQNEEKYLLEWPTSVSNFEVVFQKELSKTFPIVNYINNTIKSPEISQSEIERLKNSSSDLVSSEQGFQDDADIYRLRHLKYYTELIEKYKGITGIYPFQGRSELPIYVFIAHEKHEKYIDDTNSNEHLTINFVEFIKEIEDGISDKVKQYFDPQYVPVNKPNFYMYMISDEQFFLAINVSKYYSFSTKIADNYYKVEVSNDSVEKTNIRIGSDLFKELEFMTESQKEPVKEGVFLEREEKYLYFVK